MTIIHGLIAAMITDARPNPNTLLCNPAEVAHVARTGRAGPGSSRFEVPGWSTRRFSEDKSIVFVKPIAVFNLGVRNGA